MPRRRPMRLLRLEVMTTQSTDGPCRGGDAGTTIGAKMIDTT